MLQIVPIFVIPIIGKEYMITYLCSKVYVNLIFDIYFQILNHIFETVHQMKFIIGRTKIKVLRCNTKHQNTQILTAGNCYDLVTPKKQLLKCAIM